MENHYDMRFPSYIPYGIKYGYQYKTEIISTKSGREYRNQHSNLNLSKEYILYDSLYNFAEIKKLKEFFQLMQGRLYSFRFHDIFDNQITNKPIGVGDGKNKKFQLISNEKQIIFCPFKSSLKIQVNHNISHNYELKRGVVEFEKAPREGKPITASCTYDIAVRFAVDYLPIICEQKDLYRVEEIKLVSIS